MTLIPRQITTHLLAAGKNHPIVTLTGPRQSGKSTLLRHELPEYKYVSLEDPDMRMFAHDDPRGFIATYPDKTIIDEAQRVPELFSYLQTHIDTVGNSGMYFLAGSHNFLPMQSVSQSLAGRTAVLKLLPLSHTETMNAGITAVPVDNEIFKGGYPRLYDREIPPENYYQNYIQTYVERDVRDMKNIGNLSQFIRFIKLCAGRIGQILNLSSLAVECGIAVSTAKAWISVLEASYIVYLLRPDFNNYAKRLVKSPKLYFYDTGLACSLLGIERSDQISTHFLRGGLFENLVINEFVKHAYNSAREPNLSFWRDSAGVEVDLVTDSPDGRQGYEIKSGATFSSDFFNNLKKWAKLAELSADNLHVIYNGATPLKTTSGDVIPWEGLRPG